LAIGRDGQNVRLASKLTDYRIEIEEDPTTLAKARSEGTSKTVLKPAAKVSKEENVSKVSKGEEKKDKKTATTETQKEDEAQKTKSEEKKSEIQNPKSETNSNDQNLK
jgi:N utilization substance protein A